MSLYECVVIARQDLSVQQAESLNEDLKKVIEEQGGSIIKVEYWGLRQMAYRIRKNRKGHYTLFNIDAPATAVHELERIMRINEDILRHLVIRVDELEQGPSVIMQRRSRDDNSRSRPSKPAPVEKNDSKEEGE